MTKTIELSDIMNPFGLSGGVGVTVTNDGCGTVTITAKLPEGVRSTPTISTADLDMLDRLGTWSTTLPFDAVRAATRRMVLSDVKIDMHDPDEPLILK